MSITAIDDLRAKVEGLMTWEDDRTGDEVVWKADVLALLPEEEKP